MPKNSPNAFVWVLILGAVGCGSKQPAVFVDLSQVAASETLPSAPQTPRPQSTPGIGASSLTLPAMPASAFRLGSDKARIQQVENVLLKSRQEAFIQIEQSLRTSYQAAIQHERGLALEKLSPENQAAFDEAYGSYMNAFNDYAKNRAKLVVKLALVAGFPDLDPNSEDVPPKAAFIANLRFQKAKPLREGVAKLDKQFRSDRDAIYAKVQAEAAQRIQTVNQEFDAQIAQADAKAQADANAEVGKEQEKLQAVLEDTTVVAFPPEPGRTVTVEGTSPPAAPPTVGDPGKEELERRMRAADLSDLKIWAALRGYVISSDRRGARNGTAEFIQWKKSHLASP